MDIYEGTELRYNYGCGDYEWRCAFPHVSADVISPPSSDVNVKDLKPSANVDSPLFDESDDSFISDSTNGSGFPDFTVRYFCIYFAILFVNQKVS